MAVAGWHLARVLAPQHLRDGAGGTALIVDAPGAYREPSPYPEDGPRRS